MVREDLENNGPKGPETGNFLDVFHKKLVELTEAGKLKYPPIRFGFIRSNAHLALGIGQPEVAGVILKEAKDCVQKTLQAIVSGDFKSLSNNEQGYWEEYLKDIETLEKMLGAFTGTSKISLEDWEKLGRKELEELGGSFDYCIRDIVTIEKIKRGEPVRNTHIDSPWELNLLQEPSYVEMNKTQKEDTWFALLPSDWKERCKRVMDQFLLLRKEGKLGTVEEVELLKEKYKLEKEIFDAKLKDILGK